MNAQYSLPLRPDGKWGAEPRRCRRHQFIETRPEYVFDFSAGTSFSRKVEGNWPIPEFDHQQMNLDASGFTALAQRPLRSIEADWLRVALALYSADRFAPRRPAGPNGPMFWRRSIKVVVPVAEPERWVAVSQRLVNALEFLTEDDWSLRFEPRTFFTAEEAQHHFEPMLSHRVSWAALFSGGLDSVAGVLQWFSENQVAGLLVSGNTNTRLRDGQVRLLDGLRLAFPRRVAWLPVDYGLPFKVEPNGLESSQRCRGWIHVSLGLLAAQIAGLDRLHVFENGIGAFNLACETSQIGSQSSRAMHPVFLGRISRVASEILGTALVVRHPFALQTKAEVVETEAVRRHSGIVGASFSCEFFPNYHSRQHQCGICPSCLVRRAALHRAFVPDHGSDYSWDVLSRGMHPAIRKNMGLSKLERLVARLGCLRNGSAPWDAFLTEFPEFAEFQGEAATALDMNENQLAARFLQLHRQFADEWDDFAVSIPRLRRSYFRLAA
jgi:hypothetical protein